MYVIKKDGRREEFNPEKIKAAVNKSAERVMVEVSEETHKEITDYIAKLLKEEYENSEMQVEIVHKLVEIKLEELQPDVAKSYKDYRNFRKTLAEMTDKVWSRTQTILYRGDKENSNADSTLVSTKQSLVRGELSKQFYQQFFLTPEELKATEEGFIYVHDMRDRLYTANCCLADIGNIMKGGFESANIWINEPKSVDVACDVMGDIILSMSAQQYGN